MTDGPWRAILRTMSVDYQYFGAGIGQGGRRGRPPRRSGPASPPAKRKGKKKVSKKDRESAPTFTSSTRR